VSDASQRRPWSEGPDTAATPESWLGLEDDVLLLRIETFDATEGHDDRLLEVVGSERHFFIRQEAAKRVRDRKRLFEFEDDRHVGQILVRHLTRREDVTYLERLCARSKHVEVRSAAQVQLARLWRRLDAPGPEEKPAQATTYEADTTPLPAADPRGFEGRPPAGLAATPAPAAPAPPPQTATSEASPQTARPARAAEPVTSAALERGGVDGSLMAWAAHFLVQPLWTHLGTRGTRELLMQTRRDLLGRHPTLVAFDVTPEAHVATNLDGGPRLPGDAVAAVAAWMVAFRVAVRNVAPSVETPSVRAATAMMADALRATGFYAAFDEAEAASRG
jgi:hypothetical protein